PLDSDKDGVYDYLDKCPGTPNGVKVDKDGCPLDSDKDGVFDGLDKCPGTPKGSIVDKDGCELSISLLIHFDTNKAVVKEEYYDEIEKVANFMKNHPDIKIEIAGHTDSRGDRNKNIELSQSRAEAVMEVLITKFGIEKSKISAKGYGPDKPVDTNETEEGRSKNRRVEAVIIK
ncbi:MAG: OmpA family protein, partial [Calditerrivibrio sp.]|nr:OmpA family protein [Calditerrivibrio sp.]